MANPNPSSSRSTGAASAREPARASDAFERGLLDSARGDEVPAQARVRVALALGIGVPGLPGAVSHAGEGHAPLHDDTVPRGATQPDAIQQPAASFARVDPVRGADAYGASGGALGLASKAALVSLVGLAALWILARSQEPAAASPALATAAPAPAALATAAPARAALATATPAPALAAPELGSARTAIPEPATPPATSVEATPASPSRREPRPRPRGARAAASRPAQPPAADRQSRLLAEVARLDQARAALAGSDAPGALRHLELYRAEFPNGALTREAARIEARAQARMGGSSEPARDIGEAR
jgi:hypothetical protein